MSSNALQRVPFAIRAGLRHGRAPLGVSWIVTNRCNLHCVYCDCPEVFLKELTTTEALDAIDEMAALGTIRVHITGGEPLMRRDLPTLIERLRFHDIRVSLSSNGTLIPKKRRLVRGLRSVSLSLDGPPKNHEAHRGAGQVEEVRAALAVLREEQVDRYLTCLVLNDTTPECLDFVLATAREFGAEAYFQPALDIVLASERPSSVVADGAQVAVIFRDLAVRKARGEPVGNSVSGLEHLSTWPAQRPLPCLVKRVAVRLTPDGVLLPCHERASVPEGVSIRDGGFRAAFERLKLQDCTECWGAGRVDMRESLRRGPLGLLELFQS